MTSGTWRIEYLEAVVHGDMPAPPKAIRKTVKRAIETRLATDPVSYGKPLRYRPPAIAAFASAIIESYIGSMRRAAPW